MILLPDSSNIQYIDRAGLENFYIRERVPAELHKKIKLLNYFQQYMSENLLKVALSSDYSNFIFIYKKKRQHIHWTKLISFTGWWQFPKTRLLNGSPSQLVDLVSYVSCRRYGPYQWNTSNQ